MTIETVRLVHAPATLVHDLLTDVAAWRSWSPHVASVLPDRGHVQAGQELRVRPWFGPTTRMQVESVTPAGGMTWSTPGLGYVLRYTQQVRSVSETDSEVTFRATVDGPGGTLVSRLVAPLSASGQRRRLARLAALAELIVARR